MDISSTIISLLSLRAPTASICPSDVARALADDEATWRNLMQPVREAAARMARNGTIIITQGTQQLDPADIEKGPVRLRRGPSFPQH